MKLQNNGHGKRIGVAAVTVLAWGVATLWSWNTLAVELLGMPEMAFRHAVALGLFLLLTGWIVTIPVWFLGRTRA